MRNDEVTKVVLGDHSKVWPEFIPTIDQKHGSRYISENATIRMINDIE